MATPSREKIAHKLIYGDRKKKKKKVALSPIKVRKWEKEQGWDSGFATTTMKEYDTNKDTKYRQNNLKAFFTKDKPLEQNPRLTKRIVKRSNQPTSLKPLQHIQTHTRKNLNVIENGEKLKHRIKKAVKHRESIIYKLNAILLCCPVLPNKKPDESHAKATKKDLEILTAKKKLSPNLISSNPRRAVESLESMIGELQLAGIQCVELIVEWMLCTGKNNEIPPSYNWRGQNYLIKMYSDLDFIPLEMEARGMKSAQFSASNPLLIGPSQKLGRIWAAQSIIFEMVEINKISSQGSRLRDDAIFQSLNSNSKLPPSLQPNTGVCQSHDANYISKTPSNKAEDIQSENRFTNEDEIDITKNICFSNPCDTAFVEKNIDDGDFSNKDDNTWGNQTSKDDVSSVSTAERRESAQTIGIKTIRMQDKILESSQYPLLGCGRGSENNVDLTPNIEILDEHSSTGINSNTTLAGQNNTGDENDNCSDKNLQKVIQEESLKEQGYSDKLAFSLSSFFCCTVRSFNDPHNRKHAWIESAKYLFQNSETIEFLKTETMKKEWLSKAVSTSTDFCSEILKLCMHGINSILSTVVTELKKGAVETGSPCADLSIEEVAEILENAQKSDSTFSTSKFQVLSLVAIFAFKSVTNNCTDMNFHDIFTNNLIKDCFLYTRNINDLLGFFIPFIMAESRLERKYEALLCINKALSELLGIDYREISFILDESTKILCLLSTILCKEECGSISNRRLDIVCSRNSIFQDSLNSPTISGLIEGDSAGLLSTTGNFEINPYFKCDYGRKRVLNQCVEEGEGKGPRKEYFSLLSTEFSRKHDDYVAMTFKLTSLNSSYDKDENVKVCKYRQLVFQSDYELGDLINVGDYLQIRLDENNLPHQFYIVVELLDKFTIALDKPICEFQTPIVISQIYIAKAVDPLLVYVQGSESFWLNESLKNTKRNRLKLRFFGWILSMCIRSLSTLNVSINPLLFKKILTEPPPELHIDVLLNDVMLLDPSLCESIHNISKLSPCEFKRLMEIEEIHVNSWGEYVIATVGSRIGVSIAWQLNAIREGFYMGIDLNSLNKCHLNYRSIFNLICCKNDEKADFSICDVFLVSMDKEMEDCEVFCKTFWDVVNGLSPLDKRSFVKFVTGVSKLPVKGTEFFRIEMPFLFEQGVLQCKKLLRTLPQSHTCDNILELPNYWEALLFLKNTTKDSEPSCELNFEGEEDIRIELHKLLEDKLKYAIYESNSYGLDLINDKIVDSDNNEFSAMETSVDENSLDIPILDNSITDTKELEIKLFEAEVATPAFNFDEQLRSSNIEVVDYNDFPYNIDEVKPKTSEGTDTNNLLDKQKHNSISNDKSMGSYEFDEDFELDPFLEGDNNIQNYCMSDDLSINLKDNDVSQQNVIIPPTPETKRIVGIQEMECDSSHVNHKSMSSDQLDIELPQSEHPALDFESYNFENEFDLTTSIPNNINMHNTILSQSTEIVKSESYDKKGDNLARKTQTPEQNISQSEAGDEHLDLQSKGDSSIDSYEFDEDFEADISARSTRVPPYSNDTTDDNAELSTEKTTSNLQANNVDGEECVPDNLNSRGNKGISSSLNVNSCNKTIEVVDSTEISNLHYQHDDLNQDSYEEEKTEHQEPKLCNSESSMDSYKFDDDFEPDAPHSTNLSLNGDPDQLLYATTQKAENFTSASNCDHSSVSNEIDASKLKIQTHDSELGFDGNQKDISDVESSTKSNIDTNGIDQDLNLETDGKCFDSDHLYDSMHENRTMIPSVVDRDQDINEEYSSTDIGVKVKKNVKPYIPLSNENDTVISAGSVTAGTCTVILTAKQGSDFSSDEAQHPNSNETVMENDFREQIIKNSDLSNSHSSNAENTNESECYGSAYYHGDNNYPSNDGSHYEDAGNEVYYNEEYETYDDSFYEAEDDMKVEVKNINNRQHECNKDNDCEVKDFT